MITKTDLIAKVIDEIAPKHFDADEFSEITKSRIGQFGVITETLGTIFENSVINNALKARERLSITASRETLIQEAAGYPELHLPNAMPARIQLLIGIPTQYLLDNFMLNLSAIEFVLASDTVITISDINFLLDYDVQIIGRLINGNFTYSAQYIMNGQNPLVQGTNQFLITNIRHINGIEYVTFNVSAVQLEKTYMYHNIIETDQVFLNGIDFEYEGQLAYFNIYYRDPNSTTYEFLEKINYFSKLQGSGRHLYYNDANEGLIRIYIPDTFQYAFNSELRLDIYTTLGSKGSFTYRSGEVAISPRSFEDVIDYTGITFYPMVISDSIGGTDSLTTEQIRKMVIEYKSTLRSVDTEQDLNSFFASADTINNMVFIKKRIDVFEKQYTGFMVMRDVNGSILPTNSLDMHLTENDIDVHYIQTQRRVVKPSVAYSLKPGEYFQVIKNTDTLTPSLIAQLERDTSKFLFGCPYLIVINEDPPTVSFYLNSIDKENITDLEYSNQNSPAQFIVNKLRVTRNAVIGEDSYKVSFNMIPTNDLPDGIIDDNGNIIDDTKIKVYGLLYTDENSTEEEIMSYFHMEVISYNQANNYFVVEGYLDTDDYITLEDQLRLINSTYTAGTEDVYDHITDISGVRIGAAIYFHDGVFTEQGDYEGMIPAMDGYGLANIYSNTNDRSTFMIDMTRLVRSNISFLDEGNGEISFSLKQVPLIRYTDLRVQVSRISDIIYNTNETLSYMLNLIKNNSSIDYKLYATYGRSRYFTLENTGVGLDRLNISLNFKVRILASRADTTIINDIKTFIKPIIENINYLQSNNSIYFSNAITQVENEFKYSQNRILAFELARINEYTTLYQSIINTTRPLELMSKNELLQYVPEFVKLDIDQINIEVIPV